MGTFGNSFDCRRRGLLRDVALDQDGKKGGGKPAALTQTYLTERERR